MKGNREVAGPTKPLDKSRAPDKVRGSDRISLRVSSVSSSEEDSLSVSPISGQGNHSSDREPGELSSGSVPEDSINVGLDEEKTSTRVSSKHGSISVERERIQENRLSLSPVQKKRKFTPIVWDLDEKATQKTSASTLPLPLPVTLPLPPPPPPMLANPKQQQNTEQRTSPITNTSRETPPNISLQRSSTPPKSSSEMTLTPPKSSSTLHTSVVAKSPSLVSLQTTQIGVTRTRITTSRVGSTEHSSSVLKTTQIRVTKTRTETSRDSLYTPSPKRTVVSPFNAENNAERTKENAHRSVQSPDDSQGHSLGQVKDVDMDMAPAPRINIATSRWAEESTPSPDDNVAVMAGKSKSLSTESDEGGRLSTDDEGGGGGGGGRDGEDSMSPEPGEYIKEKSELGETGRGNLIKDYDGHMSDEYERDLNNRELMELDKDTNDDSEEEERPEVDSEEEEAPAVPVPPQRLIDMLQGCRSVDEFERLNKIDEGTYGVVYRARDKKTGEIVALKKVKMEKEREGFPMTSLREINVLLSIHHPSIVDVKEVVVGSNLDSIFMVMEYMEHDLKGLMESIKQPFSQSEVKCLMLQLFDGVKHLHDNWVLHRDLKTSNLLLNNRGELKICDFGLARQYGSPLKTYTHMVVTLWYRAPELLLGCKQYSTAVDMWSLGCIMAEFLAKEPLFNGKNELDQLDKIFKTLGTPNETIWPDFAKLPGVKCNFVKQPFNRLREKFPPTAFAGRPPLSESGFNLLNRLLLYDPKKRITAEEALNHDWFKEVPLPKMKELMPTYPARSEQDRRSRRLMKSPDPLLEQRKRELRQAEVGSGGLFG